MSQKVYGRYLAKSIKKLALSRGKMAFLSGPRQAGKTTLAKKLLKEMGQGKYYNWDAVEFRRTWVKNPSSTVYSVESGTPLFIFDEIYKAVHWKRTLKGIYDTLDIEAEILVTGSARLNVYKKGGDSLLGRYLNFRLHPFSLGELLETEAIVPDKVLKSILSAVQKKESVKARKIFERLYEFGGFPEPYLEADADLARIWRRGRLEKIIREDLRDLSRLPELSQVEMLAALLQSRVSGLLSVNSLREELEVAHTTVKRWLNYLEELYYCYRLKPYSKSVTRSLKKDPKLYLWDWSEVTDNPGARFENILASHLLKACHFWTDLGKGTFELTFLRNKEKQEIDFLIVRDSKPWVAIEAKLSDGEFSPAFNVFRKQLKVPYCFQIIKKKASAKIWKDEIGTTAVLSAPMFLSCLP